MENSPPKENKILAFVTKNVNKICALTYIIGVFAFLALPYRQFSENHYHSENALLTGLQTPNFDRNAARNAEQLNEMIVETAKNDGISGIQDHLIQVMEEYGITAYKQKFTIKSPLPQTVENKLLYQVRNGTNIYGFIRAGRAASTESIVLNVPFSKNERNYAIGLALSFGNKIRTQSYWAKDIVLLFTEMGYVGAQAWLQSYYDVRNSEFIQVEPLKERAGAILAALNIELPETPSYLNAEVVGNNGQLPNLDIFNVVTKLCMANRVRLSVGGVLSKYHHGDAFVNYRDALKTTVKMMSKQAKGFSDINHAVFLQHNVQSMTLQGVPSKRINALDVQSIGRVVEGFFRSQNNLLEKLHHSYFFYLISATDRFISIVLYMPPFGLILLAPTLKALCLWLAIRQEREKKQEEEEKSDSSNEDEKDDSIEDLIKRDREEKSESKVEESSWMEVFYILAITHLLGVVLYYSPAFAPSWSEMYNLNAEDSLVLIFLSTYSLALPLPFTSLFRFSNDPKVYDLLRVVTLVMYAMILGCTAVMNFSLAMVVAAVSAPLITPISCHSKRWKPIFILLAILASPMAIALLSEYTSQYIFSNTKAGNFWDSAKNILKNPYEQSLLGNSWNYELACLLLYPNWMLFWFLAVARTKEVS